MNLFCTVASGVGYGKSNIAATSPDGVAWVQQTLPVTAAWTGIAWNGSVFCAIAFWDNLNNPTNIAATSPDGINWTQQTLPCNAMWYAIAWNGSVFCAIAHDGNFVAISPDGINWTQQTLPCDAKWSAIAWNGSVFCAIADDDAQGTTNIAATSPDGINWTQQTLPCKAMWYDIAWNGSVFCAVAFYDGDYNLAAIAATSPDGINWTQQTLPALATWRGIAWNGSVFCAIADEDEGGATTNIAATSPDGVYWTEQTLPTYDYWSTIAWNGSVFCAVASSYSSNSAITSPDGVIWTQATLPANAYWSAIAAAAPEPSRGWPPHHDVLKLLFPLDLAGVFNTDITIEGSYLDSLTASAVTLLDEMFPDTANVTIPDWERNYGIIPDDSVTLADRRLAVVQKKRLRRKLTRTYFAALAATVGYDITIEEIPPNSSDYGGSWDTMYIWKVHVLSTKKIIYFTAGDSAAGDLLTDWQAEATLEKLFNALKPAHTHVYFIYE